MIMIIRDATRLPYFFIRAAAQAAAMRSRGCDACRRLVVLAFAKFLLQAALGYLRLPSFLTFFVFVPACTKYTYRYSLSWRLIATSLDLIYFRSRLFLGRQIYVDPPRIGARRRYFLHPLRKNCSAYFFLRLFVCLFVFLSHSVRGDSILRDFTHANLKMAYLILRKNRVSRRRTIKYGIVLIR